MYVLHQFLIPSSNRLTVLFILLPPPHLFCICVLLCLPLISSSTRLLFPTDPLVYMERQTRIQETLKDVIRFFKSLIHFYLTSVFYTSRAESVVPMQICLNPLHRHTHIYLNTYPWSTHNHTHVYTHTYIQTYIYSHS